MRHSKQHKHKKSLQHQKQNELFLYVAEKSQGKSQNFLKRHK
jgi:hypothetical protein